MSAVGGGGIHVGPLVHAIAGTAGQRRVAETERQQTEAAERKFELDRQGQMERMVGDVGASGETDERDADGRQPWVWLSHGSGQSSADSSPPSRPPAADADQEAGRQLDLEA